MEFLSRIGIWKVIIVQALAPQTWKAQRCKRRCPGTQPGCQARSGLWRGTGNQRSPFPPRCLSSAGCLCPSAWRVWSWPPPSLGLPWGSGGRWRDLLPAWNNETRIQLRADIFMLHPSVDPPWVTDASCTDGSRTVPLSKYQPSCTYASHHLSNHSIPVPTLVLSPIRTILHQLHSVFETQFYGDFRQQIHAKAFQLWAFWNRIRLLLYTHLKKGQMVIKLFFYMGTWCLYRCVKQQTMLPLLLWFWALMVLGEEQRTCQHICTAGFIRRLKS